MKVRLTNVQGLPEAIVRAVEFDEYSKGDCDYSVTQLLKPPRIVALERQYADEIVEDVSDRMWSLYGQLVHELLRRAGENEITETRYYAAIGAVRISGAVDTYSVQDKRLADYKFTSAWTLKEQTHGVRREWEEQLNCYVWLLAMNGLVAETAEIVCLLRDWSKLEAMRDPIYPQMQVQRVPIRLWGEQLQGSFLRERIALHEMAKAKLPNCLDSERWKRADSWAVMREGKERAVRVLYSEKEAENYLLDKGMKKDTIVFRKGEATRCKAYCRVAKFCSQYQEEVTEYAKV